MLRKHRLVAGSRPRLKRVGCCFVCLIVPCAAYFDAGYDVQLWSVVLIGSVVIVGTNFLTFNL